MITWSASLTVLAADSQTVSLDGSATDRQGAVDEARAAARTLLREHAGAGAAGLPHLALTIDDQVVAVLSVGAGPDGRTADYVEAEHALERLLSGQH
ncbi:hypothetical protein [Tsukamurella hominis]|uniref:hypothetical protein n=1 Tax=Tsukamurella hominis TaxID=1970232 RepID=UPI0039E92261